MVEIWHATHNKHIGMNVDIGKNTTSSLWAKPSSFEIH